MDNNNNNNFDRDKAFEELFSDNEERDYTYERERKSYNRSNAMRRAKSRRNNAKKIVLMTVIAVLLVALWIVAAVAIWRGVFGVETPDGEAGTSAGDETSSDIGSGEEDQGGDGQGDGEGGQTQGVSFVTVTKGANDYKYGKLILINHAYKYDQAGDSTLNGELVSVFNYANGSFYVTRLADQLRMDTVTAMNNMFAAFKAETGLGGYCIRDYYAWCTTQDQEKWFKDTEVKYGAGAVRHEFKAGESEHEAGRTFDLKVDVDREGAAGAVFIGVAAETEPKYAWIYDNCYKYGIIDRYPAGKENITGVSMAETSIHSDHFRFVGIPAATAMHNNDWCLEEFIIEIQKYTYNGEHLKVEDSTGVKYEMYYYPAEIGSQTEVKVPEGAKYDISGNNVDGYIVTITVE